MQPLEQYVDQVDILAHDISLLCWDIFEFDLYDHLEFEILGELLLESHEFLLREELEERWYL